MFEEEQLFVERLKKYIAKYGSVRYRLEQYPFKDINWKYIVYAQFHGTGLDRVEVGEVNNIKDSPQQFFLDFHGHTWNAIEEVLHETEN